MRSKLLPWSAVLLLLGWMLYVAIDWYTARRTGLVFSSAGLLASALVFGAFYRRSRKKLIWFDGGCAQPIYDFRFAPEARIGVTDMRSKKLPWIAVLVLLGWVLFAAINWYTARWTGFVISCTGLLATAFVMGAFYSRSRKSNYPERQ